jgi:ABC-type glycerol-3-phosphate transport system substrate-binding protein
VARQKGARAAGILPDPARRRHASDIVDIQGALWIEYAANGVLLDISPYLQADPAVGKRFNSDYLANWVYQGKNYLLPYYVTKSLMYYNLRMAKEARLEGRPQSFDEILAQAQAMSGGDRTGFLTLTFDWLYWPLFAMNGVELLTPDLKKAAFNTPAAAEVIEKLRKGTDNGAVNKTSWTGRWVEPNAAFAAGNVGMYHAHSSAFFVLRGAANWPINEDTLGIGHLPGFYSTPNSHGLAISKGAKNPDLAWDFIKLVTDARWTTEFTEMRKGLTGNTASDEAGLAKLRKEDPLAAQVLRTQIEHTDKLVATWPLANDAQIKDIFYPELQSALLGRKEPKDMLADAERGINRLLARRG